MVNGCAGQKWSGPKVVKMAGQKSFGPKVVSAVYDEETPPFDVPQGQEPSGFPDLVEARKLDWPKSVTTLSTP